MMKKEREKKIKERKMKREEKKEKVSFGPPQKSGSFSSSFSSFESDSSESESEGKDISTRVIFLSFRFLFLSFLSLLISLFFLEEIFSHFFQLFGMNECVKSDQLVIPKTFCCLSAGNKIILSSNFFPSLPSLTFFFLFLSSLFTRLVIISLMITDS